MTTYFGAHLDNCNNLHEDYGTWQNFIDTRCTLQENFKGWQLYNDQSNGFYIVTPSGTVKPPVYGLGIWQKWDRLKQTIG